MKREKQRHTDAFEIWYATDRNTAAVSQRCGVSVSAVEKWIYGFGWRERAAARDQQAAQQAEKEAVARRVRVLAEQRQAGELLRRRGVQYYTAHEVEDGREAIAAISKGIELERSAENLPAALVEILNYSEDELRAERERIIRRAAVDLDRPAALASGEPEADEPGSEDGAAGHPVLPTHADGAAAGVP